MVNTAGIPTRILVAPDSFKGTFSAEEVAAAIGAGCEAAHCPAVAMALADGGEGTAAALALALKLETRASAAHDPLGRVVEASWALSADGRIAVVEVAAASGFSQVSEAERDVLAASTYGTGELIVAAVRAGAREILVAAGGSATCDGGAGALAAVADGGGVDGARVRVLCDVRTEFEQAAVVFGPQKGADPAQVRELTVRLERLAGELGDGKLTLGGGDGRERRMSGAAGRDPRGVTMSGAAGGLAGGLWAGLGAELVGGAKFVLDTLDFDTSMRGSLAVITGEGRLDAQSLFGKVVGEVATRARQAGVPTHAVVGHDALDRFDARILDLQLIVEASTLDQLREAGAVIARSITAGQAQGR